MRTFDLNLRHLRAFAKTYELGTLLAAARAVNITQPALTQGLARLESQVNCRLFERQRDGMHATEPAKLLYPRVVTALDLIRSTRITHPQIYAFHSLARDGSYAEASTATGLARASLHRAVADLEIALGQTLVQRRGRGLELTTIGRSTARRFSLAEAELALGLEEVRACSGDDTARISIGAMPLCRARVLPASIVAFQECYPKSEILVAEGSYVELLEPLRDGELDFLIGALRDPPPGADLVQHALFEDRPVIIARSGHPLAGRGRAAGIAELARYDWCIPQRGVPLRERWHAMFEDAGLPVPRVRVECGSVITIRQILLGTDCLTILSPDQVAVELEAEWLAIIGPAPETLTRTIGITCRESWRPTARQKAFIDILSSVC
jgi:LysR family transcriptional regulator of gallate degradation